MKNNRFENNKEKFGEILKKIKTEYPNSELIPTQDNRYSLVIDLPYKGIILELRADFYCEFAFNFQNFEFFNYAALENYFKKKFQYEGVTFYINSKRIFIRINKNNNEEIFSNVFFYSLNEINKVIKSILEILNN